MELDTVAITSSSRAATKRALSPSQSEVEVINLDSESDSDEEPVLLGVKPRSMQLPAFSSFRIPPTYPSPNYDNRWPSSSANNSTISANQSVPVWDRFTRARQQWLPPTLTSDSYSSRLNEVLRSGPSENRVPYLPAANHLLHPHNTANELLGNNAMVSGSDAPHNTPLSERRQVRPSSKRRKRVKQILCNGDLSAMTRRAKNADAKKRRRLERKRIAASKQMFSTPEHQRVVLDFDLHSGQSLVEVDARFVVHMKPHQVEGVQFMYDATIESVQRLLDESALPASYGAILAHCMGLGKTFQVIVLVSTILMHHQLRQKIRCVLIVVPTNVIKNWVAEFSIWLTKCGIEASFAIIDLSERNVALKSRSERLQAWKRDGGVMLITPGLLNSLIGENRRHKTGDEQYDTCYRYLLDPGPDLVIVDEGHSLKSEASQLNQNLSQVRTFRRIILTGTPMQNNLFEYYTMVSFVKPHLLGTREEFANQYAHPIENGTFNDSSPAEVKTMKKRFFVLDKLLRACTINRKDVTVLKPSLPPRAEFVLSLALTDEQKRLYQYYIDHYVFGHRLATTSHSTSVPCERAFLFTHLHILGLIWNHPVLLRQYFEQIKAARQSTSTAQRVIDSHANPDAPIPSKFELRAVSLIQQTWEECHLPSFPQCEMISASAKFEFLFNILYECAMVGEKLVVFSQFLCVLDLIERFLQQKSFGAKNEAYYRIDGSVSAEERGKVVQRFNDPNDSNAKLCLVSTRAGGIGINLVGASRAVLFDTSWNPALDVQAIYRIYRYGQRRPVFIYRFAAHGTMEAKIYRRQVYKQATSLRLVDQCQIERHFADRDLRDLLPLDVDQGPAPSLPPPTEDTLLCKVMARARKSVHTYHHHDSLLQNVEHERLDPRDEAEAWKEFEENNLNVKPQFVPFPTAAFSSSHQSSHYDASQPMLHTPLHLFASNTTRQLASTHVNVNSFANQPIECILIDDD